MRPATKTHPSEHEEQAMLFRYLGLMASRHPECALAFAVPNGGHRHPAVAGKLRAEGVKRGVPDVVLPVPRGPHHGLFLELKRVKGGTVKPEQHAWHEQLRGQGYRVEVCRGWEAARDAITTYLNLRPSPLPSGGAE